jgi:hypothetical protein
VTRDLGFWKTASLSDKEWLKIQIMHAFKVCVFPFSPQKCFIFLLEFIYSFYDFKEYMLSISSFKNILQYSRMESNFDNEFYSNQIFLRYLTILLWKSLLRFPLLFNTIYLYRVIY